MSRSSLMSLFALGTFLNGAALGYSQAAPENGATQINTMAAAKAPIDPPASKLRGLWVINHEGLSPAEAMLAQTIQGLANKKKARVWLRSGSMHAIIEGQLKREGVPFHQAATVWELLKAFRSEVKGAIVYQLKTPSVNVATSLCGPMNAVAIDESLLPQAQATGLKVLVDVRGMDDKAAWAKYHQLFKAGTLVEQAPDKAAYLRDLPVAVNAFTFYTDDSNFRTQVARDLGPEAIAYGWGPNEASWVHDLSRANATVAASDWSLNLSALRFLPAGKLQQPKMQPVKAEAGMRYIAFVMSDGDNIQWLCKDFIDNSRYWASPLRGKNPITWEMSPILAKMGPRVLQYIYATATPNDDFIAGPGAPGYTFPHQQSDRVALAQQAAPYLRDSDLPLVTVLNENEGGLSETIPLLDQPTVQGVIYKLYSPYNGLHGAIMWHKGKPCLSYKFLLWVNLQEPEDVAREVAQMPTDPFNDEASYALVNMHAWSYGNRGGPLVTVQQTLDKMTPDERAHTRIVTARQLMAMLTENFSARHAKD